MNNQKPLIALNISVTPDEYDLINAHVDFINSFGHNADVKDVLINSVRHLHDEAMGTSQIDENKQEPLGFLKIMDDHSDFEIIREHRKELKQRLQEFKTELKEQIRKQFNIDYIDFIPLYDSLQIFTDQELTSTKLEQLKLFLGFDNYKKNNPKGSILFFNDEEVS